MSVSGTSGMVAERGGLSNETPGVATARGTLDVGVPTLFVPQTHSPTSHGIFTIRADGDWSYRLSNDDGAVQALNVGETLHDIVTVFAAGGASYQIEVTIEGANDAAIVSGDRRGGVREAGGIANTIPGRPTATGQLAASDVDNPATFAPLSAAPTAFGSITINAAGAWIYTLDNGNAAVQALNVGNTLHDVFAVATADGTTKEIDIEINGADDAAVIGGTATGSVTEASGVGNAVSGTPTAQGVLVSTDADNPPTFTAQANVTTAYGHLTIDAAGLWTYTLDNANATVQALNSGDTRHDIVIVASIDGTTAQIDVTINGDNDAATIGGGTTGVVTEAGGVLNAIAGTPTATGVLTATDPDSPARFAPLDRAESSFGSFKMGSDGAWAYKLHNGNAAVQALNVGDTVHDTFTVATVDGTTQIVDIEIHGANDDAIITGLRTGSVTEKGGISNALPGIATAKGDLDVRDVDDIRAFTARVDAPTTYGTFSITALGRWRYVLDDGNAVVQALDAGDTLHDIVAVTAADGTTHQVDITIHGADDLGVSAADLTPAEGFVIRGESRVDLAGRSVSSAGDLNGDGFADMIIGAPLGNAGGRDFGNAYVVFGKGSAFTPALTLSGLGPDAGFIIKGPAKSGYAGWSVSAAGDVNGDGLGDLIVGAPDVDAGAPYSGAAWVVFGKPSGFGMEVNGRALVDLAGLAPADGFLIRGSQANSDTGFSVSKAGDVNGDGFDDLIVGMPHGGEGSPDSGAAYVLFGKASGFGTVEVGSLPTADGFVIRGVYHDRAGYAVSAAGDVNGDGFHDIVVSAEGGYSSTAYYGNSYVIFGKDSGFGTPDGAGRNVIDLAYLAPADGFVIQRAVVPSYGGTTAASAGDVNGDGLADLIVAKTDDVGGGEAYVVFGKTSGVGPVDGTGRIIVDLADLAPGDGFVLSKLDPVISASAAGDVNGDGFGDLIVGDERASIGAANGGRAWLVFGGAAGFGPLDGAGREALDLEALSPNDGFAIVGGTPDGYSGSSVSSAGDLNGDGFDDLMIGAPFANGGRGEVTVLFGGAFGATVTTTGTSAAEMLIGGASDDALSGGGGADVVRGGAGDDTITVGDVSFRSIDGGTGIDILAVAGTGLTLDLVDRVQAARVSAIERIDLTGAGNNALKLDRLAVINEAATDGNGVHVLTVDGNAGDMVTFADSHWSTAETFVDGPATYNVYRDGNAEVRVRQGVTVTFPTWHLTNLAPDQGFVIIGDADLDNAGQSVASAGDVNGDGFADLIVGAPGGDDGGSNAGEAYVIFGKATGFADVDLATLDPDDGFVLQGDELYRAGTGVGAADVNGDGLSDLIVGAPQGGVVNAGRAVVVFGRTSGVGSVDGTGRAVVDLATLAVGDGFVIGNTASSTYNNPRGIGTGEGVSAGDINGDGFADMIVATLTAREAYVVFGGPVNSGVIDVEILRSDRGFIIRGDELERSVASGDINGDGIDDLIIGAPGSDAFGVGAGAAFVVFGKQSGFGAADDSGRQVVDLADLAPQDGFLVHGSTNARVGVRVAATDVNGDGFDDLLVARGQSRVYVVFGAASGIGTEIGGRAAVDLETLSPTDGFAIAGFAGPSSVASAGDINGDGFGDVIVGNTVGSVPPRIVFGKASGFGTLVGGQQVLDVSTLAPADGFALLDTISGLGYGVSSAGDVDGDGFDDLIVGARNGDDGGNNAGQAYVVFGGAFGAVVTTTGTTAAEILVGGSGDDMLSGGGGGDSIRGGAGNDSLSVGDLGFRAIDGGSGSDTLALAGTGLTLDLSDRLQAVKIDGVERIDLGSSANNTLRLDRRAVLTGVGASAGGRHILTVSGDASDAVSFVDVQWVNFGTIVDSGTTYDRYVSGNAEVRIEQGVDVEVTHTFGIAALPPSQGFVLQGDAAGDRAGSGVARAGDVNGDGVADLVVGAPQAGGSFRGEAYVVYGRTSGFGSLDGDGRSVVDLANADSSFAPSAGFVIRGGPSGLVGTSVSAAGDVNGDGFTDLIVGAPGESSSGTFAGSAFVVFGGASGFGSIDGTGRAVINLATLPATVGFVIEGAADFDRAGSSVSTVGDVNGDGFADLIVGSVYNGDGGYWAGAAYVVFGKPEGFGTPDGAGRQVIDLGGLAASEGFIIQGISDDRAGFRVSSAGDINGDGFDDMAVTTVYAAAYVVFGKAAGFGSDVGGRRVVDLATIDPSSGFVLGNAGFAAASAGDVNGDGFDDLIAGTGSRAVVLFGQSAAFGTPDGAGRDFLDLTSVAPAAGFVIRGIPGSQAGYAVSSAGDLNGDGYDDLLVGAPDNDVGNANAGAVYVVFGKATGFGTLVGGERVVDLAALAAADGLSIFGEGANDRLGRTVAAAGDVNGDGFADLIVGAPFGDDGGADAGEAYVLFGGAFGAATTPVTTSGGTGAESLVGGLGDDVLSGAGGADSLRGGAGDDVLTIGSLAFRGIDGGSGDDTLALGGAGLTLDLVDSVQAAKIAGIERIDLTGSGNNALKIDRLGVLNEAPANTDGVHILTVEGNAGDSVSLAEAAWVMVGTVDVGSVAFDRYVNGAAEVRVEQGVSVVHPLVFDVTVLQPSQGFVIQGDAAGDQLGRSVSRAGDVNGDGFADMILGVPYGDDGGGTAGEAYVLFGTASGFGIFDDATHRHLLDLTSLAPTAGFVVQGDAAGDRAGWSVSGAGDVNGDGYADLIVGATLGDDGDNAAGEAYIVFGKASGLGTVDGTGRTVVDLTNLGEAGGFIVQGDTATDNAGWSVSAAGDVNGDGYVDVIVGARSGDDGGVNAGEAYVVFGNVSGFGTLIGGRRVVDLSTLAAGAGFIVRGDVAGDLLGSSVSAAGDVNGDGFADLIVGAPSAGPGDAGAAWVVFGKASGFGTVDGIGRTVIDLTSLGSDGFVIQAGASIAGVGRSVSAAGDVNGDGFDDVIIGAPFAAGAAGEAYVVFGKASGFGTVDLTSFAPSIGFVLLGDDDTSGYSVASAGDVNGDGYDDLIVGAVDGGADFGGRVYVIFGKTSGFGAVDGSGRAVLDLANLASADGFAIDGDAVNDRAGFSVSGAGDVNGDGFDDLMVGAPNNAGGSYNGEVYVLFGGAFGGSTVPVVSTGTAVPEMLIGGAGDDVLTGGGGDNIRGGAGNDRISVGDLAFRSIDGGSGDDSLVLAGTGLTLDLADPLQAAKIAGIEHIDLAGTGNNLLKVGKLAVLAEAPAGSDGIHVLTVEGDAGDMLAFAEAQWTRVGTVSSAGVTFDRFVNGNAEVRAEQGLTVGFSMDLTALGPTQGFVLQGYDGEQVGTSVSAAGDVNGDGFGDLIVGAPYAAGGGASAGGAYVVFGKASGFGTVDATGRAVIDLENVFSSFTPSRGFLIQGDLAGDQAGFKVSSAGDVNGDGFDDMIIGALLGDGGGASSGEAYVVLGKASGFGTLDPFGRAMIDLSNTASSFTSGTGFIIRADAAGDQLSRVSSAGDINADGFDDLIVGAPLGADGGTNAGEAYVVFGKASSFGTVDGSGRAVIDFGNVGSSFDPSDGFVIQGDNVNDRLGTSVASAGDVNGDGFADLIVGASLGDDGGGNAGEAYVVFGTASGFGTTDGTGRAVIDLSNVGSSFTSAQGFIIRGDQGGDQVGLSVSSAGDVNGDGLSDLIVGAPFGDDGGSNAGEAYVVFGKTTAFGTVDGNGRASIDLANVSSSFDPSDGFVVQGGAIDDQTGFAVSSAGDINGDGFGDLVVGAWLADGSGADAGAAYVVFGKASGFGSVNGTGRAVIDVDTLGAGGFAILGDAAGDFAGASVSAAGDVNGDGFADLIIGARQGDDGGNNAGEAYIVFGGAFGASLTTNGTLASEMLIGSGGNDILNGGGGGDVMRGGAGDDRLIVGDDFFRSVDGGGGNDKLTLVWGNGTLDLTLRQRAARISGIETIELGGAANNTLKLDRLAVINMVGADAGGVHVLTVDGSAGNILSFGDGLWSKAGTIVVEGTTYDRYVRGNAEVRAVQALTIGFFNELAFLQPSNGFVIQGDGVVDEVGWSVAPAGDLNGDGFDDLVIGAPKADDAGGFDMGETYVVFGTASGFGTVDASGRAVLDLANVGSSFTPATGFVVRGDVAYDWAGWSVASAGDINGDGFDDLIIGARTGDLGGASAGEAYVVFGTASGFGAVDGTGRAIIDLGNAGSTFSSAKGFVIRGDTAGDQLGLSVASAGDVNGDGIADLVVGAPYGDDTGTDSGEAYVIYGSVSGFGTVDGSGRAVLDVSNVGSSFDPSKGFVVRGRQAFAGGTSTGFSVSSAGDVNGDGLADLIVGAPIDDRLVPGVANYTKAGRAYLVFGTTAGYGTVDAAGRAVVDVNNLGTGGFAFQGDDISQAAGLNVASAGDVNGDGFDDIIVGAPRGFISAGANAGKVYLVLGSGSGFPAVLDGSNAAMIMQTFAPGDQVGFSVAGAGDVNGDGLADMIVGARGQDAGGSDAGAAFVVFGQASGLPSQLNLGSLTPAQGFAIRGAAAGDQAGYSVSSAGDINGDGFDDLVVGAPFNDAGGNLAGGAYVIYGGAFGGSTTAVFANGTATAEVLLGGVGNDALSGGGGADSIRGGAGNDTLTVPDLGFRSIDGGGGKDTLVLAGAGQTFDFTTLSDVRVRSIETIDITGTGSNTLRLGGDDVMSLADGGNFDFTVAGSANNLVIDGNVGDMIELLNWDPDGAGGAAAAVWQLVQSAAGLDGSSGGAYNIYDLVRGSSTLVSLAVDSDILKI